MSDAAVRAMSPTSAAPTQAKRNRPLLRSTGSHAQAERQMRSVASPVVALGLAASSTAALIAGLICAASISFGSLYTPGMSLTSHRAESAGLAQGLAFGVMNTAWAFGELVGPTVGGASAESVGDAVPYAVGACLCALTLAATYSVAGRLRPREA